MERMRDQVDELRAAQDHIEQLVQVIVEIGSDLDLHGTLHRIVKAAMELTGARFGALGIHGADNGFASFIQAGIDVDIALQLGNLAVGEGLRI
jgi:hypothetical protein